MTIIISGSRHMTDAGTMGRKWQKLKTRHNFTDDEAHIITGGAKGADTLAENLARARGIKLTVINADWGKHGKAAGPIRNRAMIKLAGPEAILLAFREPGSKGTANAIAQAKAAGLTTYISDIETTHSQPPEAEQLSLFDKKNTGATNADEQK